MAIISKRPITPSMRSLTTADYSVLTKKAPEKSLLKPVKKTGGRNSYGRITVRHIGGGNRQKYRIIDFKRTKDGIPATVVEMFGLTSAKYSVSAEFKGMFAVLEISFFTPL